MLATLNWPRLAHWSKIILFLGVIIAIQSYFPRTGPEGSLADLWLNRLSLVAALGAVVAVEFIELFLARRKGRILFSLGIYTYALVHETWSSVVAFYGQDGPSIATQPVNVVGYIGTHLIQLLLAYSLFVAAGYCFDRERKFFLQRKVWIFLGLGIFIGVAVGTSLLDYLFVLAK